LKWGCFCQTQGGPSQPQPYRLALPLAWGKGTPRTRSRARPGQAGRDRPGPTATAPLRDRATHQNASLSTSHWGRHSDIARQREAQLNCALDSGADLRQHCRDRPNTPVDILLQGCLAAWCWFQTRAHMQPSAIRRTVRITTGFEDPNNNNMTSSCQARRGGRMTAKAISTEMINGASFLLIGF
jgi:hypothetical protein